MFFQGNDDEAGHWGRELTASGEGSYDVTQLNSMIAGGGGDATSYFHGDYYRETDDTVRGLTLDAFQGQHNEASVFGKSFHDSLDSSEYDSRLETKKAQLEQGSLEQMEQVFQEGDLPPQLPEDSGFALSEATAVRVKDEAAWCAGNRLLTFLSKEVSAHVTKLNRIKFTLKAEVLCEKQTCTVKVRVYRLSLSIHTLNFVFEFQRQGGDSFAFSGFLGKARQCLCPAASIETELACEKASMLYPPASLQYEDSDCLVTPLVDAACHAGDRSIQASAAAGLAEVAEDSVKHLCTDTVFTAIQRLMQVDSFEVSSHVSRLLSRLAESREADAYFVREGMLDLLLEKIRALTDGKLLRRRLAEAVLGLVKRTDTKVPPQAAQDLEQAASA